MNDIGFDNSRGLATRKTVKKTYADIPKEGVSKIIPVDDVSQDQTVELRVPWDSRPLFMCKTGEIKTCYLGDPQGRRPGRSQAMDPTTQELDLVIGSRLTGSNHMSTFRARRYREVSAAPDLTHTVFRFLAL